MTLTTQGIVLHTTKYGETSIIAKVFTRQLGLCSYIVKGVRSPKGRTKQNLLQPMSHLMMTVYNNPKKQLQYIKEMHPASRVDNLYSDGLKMSLLFFMDEVLYKSIKESEPNESLFDYVVDELQQMNTITPPQSHSSTFTYFPIRFLLRTARHLGIEPMDNYSVREPVFNLKEGRFLAAPTVYSASTNDNIDYFLDGSASYSFHDCLSSFTQRGIEPHLSPVQRANTLNNLLEYYHIHLSDFHNFTSHQILHSVLR